MADERRKGIRLIEWILLVVIVLLICCIVIIPGLMSSRRASNERNTSTSLKTLSSAEADFRANDRDWNHVNDFWTGDVKGLYTMTSAKVRGAGSLPDDPPIKLIEVSVAAADADPTLIPAGGENLPLRSFGTPSAKAGYWFAAMLRDQTLKDTPEAIYKQDTAGTPSMGKCHNLSKFGFTAFPDLWSAGKYRFVVNENSTIFRQLLDAPGRNGTAIPPGIEALDQTFLDWPDDETWKSWNRKLDP
jgi:hypothetical protein